MIFTLVQNTTDIPFSLDSCKNIIPIVIDKKMPLDEAFAKNSNCHAILKLSFVSNTQKLNATIYKKQKFPLEFYSAKQRFSSVSFTRSAIQRSLFHTKTSKN